MIFSYNNKIYLIGWTNGARTRTSTITLLDATDYTIVHIERIFEEQANSVFLYAPVTPTTLSDRLGFEPRPFFE